MTLSGTDADIFFLAFDHRGEFVRSIYDIAEEAVTPARIASVRDAKNVVLAAGLAVRDAGTVSPHQVGVLVDGLYGASAAQQARTHRMVLAMPVEISDQDVFALQYGTKTRAHVRKFQPDFVKILVRFNSEDSTGRNAVQLSRIKELSDWLQRAGQKLLFELVIPPTRGQLEICQSQQLDFGVHMRPALMTSAVRIIQQAGIQVDLWKVEGIDRLPDAQDLVRQVRAGADHVGVIVLGAAQPADRVIHWLQVAAATEGYRGFAIGRSIWRDPLRAYVRGLVDRVRTVQVIAENYATLISAFQQARVAAADTAQPAPAVNLDGRSSGLPPPT